MDPITLGIGGGILLAGTGASVLAARQKQKAVNRALNSYEAASNAHGAREKEALAAEQAAAYGLRDLHFQGLSRRFSELGATNAPVDVSGQRQGLAQAVGDAAKAAPTGGNSFSYQGAPQTSLAQALAGETQQRQQGLAEMILQQHQQKVQDAQRQDGDRRASLRDLLLQAKGADVKRKFAIAKALRDLDWQHQQVALQGDLDRAQTKGQWLGLLGGLGQSAGGVTMAAGAGAGAGAGGGDAAAGKASGLSAWGPADSAMAEQRYVPDYGPGQFNPKYVGP